MLFKFRIGSTSVSLNREKECNMKKLLLGVLLACVFVSGCGNSAATNEMAAAKDAYYDDYAAEAAESYYDDYSYAEEADVAMESSSYTTTGVTFAQNKKIIYQSNVVLETKTYDETYSRLIDLINENGGYIEFENYNNEKRSYLKTKSSEGNIVISTNTMTIRIPSKNYANFMQEGLTLGNVLNRNQSIQDKTSEYNTNKSYVDILNDEAEYLAKQLNVLEDELKAAQANDRYYDEIIENMKDIAERKAQVEKELVPYKRTMDEIDEKVEYSTISMEIREVDEFTVIEEEVEEETFGSQVKASWNKAMTTLSNMLKGTLLFLIAIIPAVVYIAIFALIAFAIWKLVKKIRKNSGAGKKTGNNQAPTNTSTFVADYTASQAAKIAANPVVDNPVYKKPVAKAGTTPGANKVTAGNNVANQNLTKPSAANQNPVKPATTQANQSQTKTAPVPAATQTAVQNVKTEAQKADNPKADADKQDKAKADSTKTEKQKVYVSRAEAKAAKEAKKNSLASSPDSEKAKTEEKK